MEATTGTVGFRTPASTQFRNLLALQNAEFSFTDKTIRCALGHFIPFHGFLVDYYNTYEYHPVEPVQPIPQQHLGVQVGASPVNNQQVQLPWTGISPASNSVINLQDYTVLEVAQVVLFLYVGNICVWPTSIVRFVEVMLALGCNPSNVNVMGPMSSALYDVLWASQTRETAQGKKIRFWSDNDGVLTAHFIYANGISHIEVYSVGSSSLA